MEIKYRWYDKLLLTFLLLSNICILIYYVTVKIEMSNIKSGIYLTSIYLLNILALSATTYIIAYNVIFRKYLITILMEINAIEQEVSAKLSKLNQIGN